MMENRTSPFGLLTSFPENPDQEVFWVVGGTNYDLEELSTSEYYDFSDSTWKEGPSMMVPRYSFCILDFGTKFWVKIYE